MITYIHIRCDFVQEERGDTAYTGIKKGYLSQTANLFC